MNGRNFIYLTVQKLGSISTFAEWGETYLGLEGVKALRTYVDRVQTLRYQLIQYFAKKVLYEITPEDIESYRAQRLRRNGNPSTLGTINKDHTLLERMLGVAVCR